jgi:3-hydroxybutyryl-CoA dehydratase
MNAYRWEDLRVGLREAFDVALTAEMFDAFRALSGDENPLHADAEYAVRAGFPGRVAFGLLTSAFYSRLVGVHLPGKHALFHGLSVEFVTPAFAGDVLRVSGEVTHLSDAVRRIELRALILNQADKTVSRAKLSVGLHAA